MFPNTMCLHPECFKKVVADHNERVALTCGSIYCHEFMRIIDDAKIPNDAGGFFSTVEDVGKKYYKDVTTYKRVGGTEKRYGKETIVRQCTKWRALLQQIYASIDAMKIDQTDDHIERITNNINSYVNSCGSRKRSRSAGGAEIESELDSDTAAWTKEHAIEHIKQQLIRVMRDEGYNDNDAARAWSIFDFVATNNIQDFAERWNSKDEYMIIIPNDNDDVDSVGAGARDIVDTGSAVAMQRLNIV